MNVLLWVALAVGQNSSDLARNPWTVEEKLSAAFWGDTWFVARAWWSGCNKLFNSEFKSDHWSRWSVGKASLLIDRLNTVLIRLTGSIAAAVHRLLSVFRMPWLRINILLNRQMGCVMCNTVLTYMVDLASMVENPKFCPKLDHNSHMKYTDMTRKFNSLLGPFYGRDG